MMNIEVFAEPVIQRAVVLKFEGTDGMGNALQGVGLPMGEIIRWLDFPFIARFGVGLVENPINHWIAQIEVGRTHVDFCPQGLCPILKFSKTHLFK